MKSIIECLKNSIINEMAYGLSDLKNKVDNLSDQILQNWCLVKLSDEYPDKGFAINRQHWATELKTHMKSIVKMRLKSGRKDKAIRSVWIDALDLDDNVEVAKAIRGKLNDEGLQKYVNKISYECADAADEIVKVLASSEEEVDSYIQGELG